MKIRSFRMVIILFIISICIILYAGISNDPGFFPFAAEEDLPGDWLRYFWRFICSLLFLGVLPFMTVRIFGFTAADIGIRKPDKLFNRKILLLPLLLGVPFFGILSAYSPGFSRIYPYSKSLVMEIAAGKTWLIAGHSILYLILYYIPWEILFRGILILPVLQFLKLDTGGENPYPKILFIASLQSIPTAMLHYGHPIMESLGAVAFGFLLAIVVIRTKSLFWPLIIHGGVGIFLDFFIILRHIGVLP